MDAYRSPDARYTNSRNVDYRAKLQATIQSMQQANNPANPTCECGSPMALRVGSYGSFYGCSRYPRCCKTRKIGEVQQ